MPAYSISYTSDSVTVRVRGLASGQDIRIYIRYDADEDSVIVDDTVTAASSTVTETYGGLESGVKYAVNVNVIDADGWLGKKTFTTPEPTPSFEPFDWDYAGLDSSGNPVYGGDKKAGLGIYVKADEWNTLAGLVQSATGKSVTTVNPGDPILAETVNTMARALGVKTVTANVDAITASFFNTLRDKYNALS